MHHSAETLITERMIHQALIGHKTWTTKDRKAK